MAIPEKYKKINFVPPAAVAREAAKGLVLRSTFHRGGTSVGIARARELKNREAVHPTVIKRMYSYFARHEVDKKGKDWDNKTRPSNGKIAWLLWGGGAGRVWATTVRGQMIAADKKRSKV
jgi:hypothetical protein